MLNDYTEKVAVLAKWKYEIDKDILLEYEEVIGSCYVRNFTPIRTVETIANILFE